MHKIPSNQRGVTLISLMIALLIGSFLLAGLFQVWFQTRQTFSAQGQLALLQDNERMALTIMANTIQTGGYYPIYLNYKVPLPSPLYSQTGSLPIAGDFAAAGQYIYGSTTTTGTTTSDSLEVRFVADPNTLDCQGQADTPTGSIVINTYSVSGGNLVCTVTVTNLAGTTLSTRTSLPIVTGVASLAMRYNVAIPGSSPTYEYMTAANVNANNYWGFVQSAQITLTFNNPLYGQSGQTQTTLSPISRIVALTQTAQ